MEILRDEANVIFQPDALANFGLKTRLSEVDPQGFDDLFLAVLDAVAQGQVSQARTTVRPGNAGDSRPVELSELDKPELDVSGLVLQEGLFRAGDPFLDLVDWGVLQLGDINCTHGGDG